MAAAQKFTYKLGKSLLKELPDEVPEGTLKDAFKDAINTLHRQDLKKELEKNFKKHYSKLERIMKTNSKTVQKKSQSKGRLGEELVQSEKRGGNESGEPNIQSNKKAELKFTWLPKMQKLLKQSVTCNAVEDTLQALLEESDMDKNKCAHKANRAKNLAAEIRACLSACHLKLSSDTIKESSEKLLHLMSALLSIYVDLCCIYCLKKVEKKKRYLNDVCSYVFYILHTSPEGLLEVILQSTSITKQTIKYLLPSLRRFIQCQPAPQSHQHYLKHVLAIQKVAKHCDEGKQLEMCLHAKTLQPVEGFYEWLKKSCTEALDLIQLKKSSYRKPTFAVHIVQNANEAEIAMLQECLYADSSETGTDNASSEQIHIEVTETDLADMQITPCGSLFFIDTNKEDSKKASKKSKINRAKVTPGKKNKLQLTSNEEEGESEDIDPSSSKKNRKCGKDIVTPGKGKEKQSAGAREPLSSQKTNKKGHQIEKEVVTPEKRKDEQIMEEFLVQDEEVVSCVTSVKKKKLQLTSNEEGGESEDIDASPSKRKNRKCGKEIVTPGKGKEKQSAEAMEALSSQKTNKKGQQIEKEVVTPEKRKNEQILEEFPVQDEEVVSHVTSGRKKQKLDNQSDRVTPRKGKRRQSSVDDKALHEEFIDKVTPEKIGKQPNVNEEDNTNEEGPNQGKKGRENAETPGKKKSDETPGKKKGKANETSGKSGGSETKTPGKQGENIPELGQKNEEIIKKNSNLTEEFFNDEYPESKILHMTENRTPKSSKKSKDNEETTPNKRKGSEGKKGNGSTRKTLTPSTDKKEGASKLNITFDKDDSITPIETKQSFITDYMSPSSSGKETSRSSLGSDDALTPKEESKISSSERGKLSSSKKKVDSKANSRSEIVTKRLVETASSNNVVVLDSESELSDDNDETGQMKHSNEILEGDYDELMDDNHLKEMEKYGLEQKAEEQVIDLSDSDNGNESSSLLDQSGSKTGTLQNKSIIIPSDGSESDNAEIPNIGKHLKQAMYTAVKLDSTTASLLMQPGTLESANIEDSITIEDETENEVESADNADNTVIDLFSNDLRSPLILKARDEKVSSTRLGSPAQKNTIMSPTENKTIMSPTENKTIMSPTENKTIKSPTQNKTIKSPTENKAIMSPTENKAIKSPTQSKTIMSPTENKTIMSPTENKTIMSPTENKTIMSPTENKAIMSPTENKAIKSPTQSKTIMSPNEKKTIMSPTENKTSMSPTENKAIKSPTQNKLVKSPMQNDTITSPTQNKRIKSPEHNNTTPKTRTSPRKESGTPTYDESQSDEESDPEISFKTTFTKLNSPTKRSKRISQCKDAKEEIEIVNKTGEQLNGSKLIEPDVVDKADEEDKIKTRTPKRRQKTEKGTPPNTRDTKTEDKDTSKENANEVKNTTCHDEKTPKKGKQQAKPEEPILDKLEATANTSEQESMDDFVNTKKARLSVRSRKSIGMKEPEEDGQNKSEHDGECTKLNDKTLRRRSVKSKKTTLETDEDMSPDTGDNPAGSEMETSDAEKTVSRNKGTPARRSLRARQKPQVVEESDKVESTTATKETRPRSSKKETPVLSEKRETRRSTRTRGLYEFTSESESEPEMKHTGRRSVAFKKQLEDIEEKSERRNAKLNKSTEESTPDANKGRARVLSASTSKKATKRDDSMSRRKRRLSSEFADTAEDDSEPKLKKATTNPTRRLTGTPARRR